MNGFLLLNHWISIIIFLIVVFIRIINITNLRLMKTTNQLQVEKSIMVWTRIITEVVVEGLVLVTVTETISTHPRCHPRKSNLHHMSWWVPSAINYQVMEEFRPAAARVSTVENYQKVRAQMEQVLLVLHPQGTLPPLLTPILTYIQIPTSIPLLHLHHIIIAVITQPLRLLLPQNWPCMVI